MPLTTIYDGGTRVVGDTSALEESLHPAVMAYVNAMSSPTGGNYAMTVNEIDAVNNMVKAMVANGIWSKMKAVYPIIGGTAAAHKYNLLDPRDADAAYRLAFNGGGWTHSSTGMTPNGTSSWANTFLNLSTVLSVSSGHISYYSRTQSLLTGNVDMGASTSPGGSANLSSLIIGRNTNSSLFTWGTQAANTLASISSSSSQGFFIGNQNAATAAGRNIYRNGIIGTSATTYGPPSMPNATMGIGALHNSTVGGGVLFSSRQCAFASIGDGLTAIEAQAFSTIVQAYQTKLGRQV